MDAGGAGAVTHQRHVSGVAAEVDDVLLEPVERGDLVHQAEVGGRPLVRIRVGVEETCSNQQCNVGKNNQTLTSISKNKKKSLNRMIFM